MPIGYQSPESGVDPWNEAMSVAIKALQLRTPFLACGIAATAWKYNGSGLETALQGMRQSAQYTIVTSKT